jgi:hypothetical protein
MEDCVRILFAAEVRDVEEDRSIGCDRDCAAMDSLRHPINYRAMGQVFEKRAISQAAFRRCGRSGLARRPELRRTRSPRSPGRRERAVRVGASEDRAGGLSDTPRKHPAVARAEERPSKKGLAPTIARRGVSRSLLGLRPPPVEQRDSTHRRTHSCWCWPPSRKRSRRRRRTRGLRKRSPELPEAPLPRAWRAKAEVERTVVMARRPVVARIRSSVIDEP